MQPLKRFTQCGSLTMLFGIFIILFGVSSTALTTFGKSNNQPPPTAGPIVKGIECSTHENCDGIDGTSCVRDIDRKMRCLCGNDEPPNNGLCKNKDKEKGLRHRCNNTGECDYNLICSFENTNRTIGVAKFMSNKSKMCLCDNEKGFFEDVVHDICSGKAATIANIIVSLLSILVPFVVFKHMKADF